MFRSGAILVAVLAALAATPDRAAIAAPFIDGTFTGSVLDTSSDGANLFPGVQAVIRSLVPFGRTRQARSVSGS